MKKTIITLIACAFFVNLKAIKQLPILKWQKRSAWINVKTDVSPQAVGDGITDDTQAIQAAINLLSGGYSGYQAVYLPAGNYKISGTLHMQQTAGKLIVGDGRKTRIFWAGSPGGRMFWSDGCPYSRYIGIVWDGSNIAAAGIDHDSYSYFETSILHKHEEFDNFTDAGIRIGQATTSTVPGYVQSAELYYKNCIFKNNTSGVEINWYNDLDNLFDGCEFINNSYGVNCPVGAGDFMILNSHFENSSQCDIVGCIHAASIRRCTSKNSARFYQSSIASGKNALAIQDCWIDSWTNTTSAINFGAGGPLTIFDCNFTNPPNTNPPVNLANNNFILLKVIASNNISNNTSSVIDPGISSEIINVNSRTKLNSISSPTTSFFTDTVLNQSKKVFDVKLMGAIGDGVNDDTPYIQACIDSVRNRGDFSVVYIPAGDYKITTSLQVTGGKYYIEGSGIRTRLTWAGGAAGTLLSITDPENLNISNIEFSTTSDCKIIHQISLSPTTCSKITYDYLYTSLYGSEGVCVFDGLNSRSTVIIDAIIGPVILLNSSESHIFANQQYGAIQIQNPLNKPKSGYQGFKFANSGNGMAYNNTRYGIVINDNQNLIIGDYYYESGEECLYLSGNGNTSTGKISIQGNRMHWLQPTGIRINDYKGKISIGKQGIDPTDAAAANFTPATFEHIGTNPCDLIIAGVGFVLAPVFNLQPSCNLIFLENSAQDVNGNQIATPNVNPSGNFDVLAPMLDDMAELGAYDLYMNYGVATSGYSFTNCTSVTTDLNEIKEGTYTNLTLYPNPTADEINFAYELDDSRFINIEVYNQLGQQVFFSDKKIKKINVNDYPKGIYTIKITSLSNIMSGRFCKK